MRAALLALLLLLSLPAMAGEAKGSIVSLHARASQMLPDDEVVVRFRIEAAGSHAAVLRRQVDRISRAVSDRLGREKGVMLTTTGRRIDPVWRDDKTAQRRVRSGWRLVQTGRAVSRDLAAVPGWVNAIERAGAHLDGLRFRASPSALQAARERLRLQAIARFRTQAAATAKALGASSFRILSLNTDGAGPGPVPMMARMGSAPSLAAGESRVSVTVSGQILLPERDYPVK